MGAGSIARVELFQSLATSQAASLEPLGHHSFAHFSRRCSDVNGLTGTKPRDAFSLGIPFKPDRDDVPGTTLRRKLISQAGHVSQIVRPATTAGARASF
jgi:hypothetical protein